MTFTDCLMFYSCYFSLKENEVAEVQPPPVILYPQSQDQSQSNGAGHYSQGGSSIRPIEPPPQPPVEPRYPPQYDPRFPDPRHTGQTDGGLDTEQPEKRYLVTRQRRPSPPVVHPVGHADTSGSGVSDLYSIICYQGLGPVLTFDLQVLFWLFLNQRGYNLAMKIDFFFFYLLIN